MGRRKKCPGTGKKESRWGKQKNPPCLSLARPLSSSPLALLSLLCVLATTLFAARCDDLAEPVAITPDDLRPAIVTDLSLRVNEDGSLILDVEADDPNGEALTLALTTPPLHGTAVLEAHNEAIPVAAKQTASPARPPAVSAPEEPDAPLPSNAPRRAMPKPATRTNHAAPARVADLHASIRVLQGAQRPTARANTVVVGRIRYTPEVDFNGTDRFGFSVRNASGYVAEAEVTIRIDAEPDAPSIVRSLDDLTLAPGQRVTLNLRTENVFTDTDGDVLVYTALSRDPTVATAEVTNDEVLTVQALNAPNRTTLIDVTATDAGGLAATTSFSVTVQASDNRPPAVENPISDRALLVGETYTIALNAVFTDADDDVLAFTATSSNPDVALAGIAPPDTLHVTMLRTGIATITVTASDGIATTQAVFLVFLNPGVNAVDDAAETDTDVPVVIDVLENDRDSDNGPLFVAGFLQFPAHGAVDIIDDGQRVRYTPTPAFFGTDRFTYVASNEQGILDQAVVTVQVREVNQPPEITDLLGPTSGFVGDSFTFTATATDPNEGDVLRYTWDFGDGSETRSGEDLTMVTHVYTADATFIVTLTVADDEGASDTATLSVAVALPTQTKPVANPDSYSLAEGDTLTVEAALGVLANDLDPRGNTLTATLVSTVAHGALAFNADGSFRYIHDGSETLRDAFRYQASDGVDETNEATVTLVISPVNDPPVAADDSYSVDQDGVLTVTPDEGVLANDIDFDGDDDDLSAVLGEDVTNGTLTFNANGSFTYTPDVGFFGNDIFTYRANDGIDASNEASVRIQINQAGNTPPEVTTPPTQNSLEGQSITPLQIVATDPDPPLTYTTVTLPSGLSLDPDTGLITGVPAIDAAGPDGTTTYAVTIFVIDVRGGQAAVTFDWIITNPVPAIEPVSDQNQNEGDPISSIQIEATDDDPMLSYDDDGTLPPGVSITADTGLISGTPTADAAGPTGSTTYSVTITVSDEQGGTASTTFKWIITNPQPVVNNPGDQANSEGESVSLEIQATDDDIVTYTASGLPPGLAIDADTGGISGTVAMEASSGSPYAVEVTVSDNQLGTGGVQFEWTVTNPPPVVTNPGNQNSLEGESPTLQIQATDPDLPLTYTATNLPTGLTIDAVTGLIDGTIATSAAGPAGSTTYMTGVTVFDSQGASSTVAFDWAVTNPTPVVTDPGDQNNVGGETVSLAIQATDDDPVTYAATGLPPGVSLDEGTGAISGTLALDAGDGSPYTVEVVVTDTQTGATAVQFDWFVDHPAPVLDGISPASAAQGATLDVTLTGANFIDGVSTVAFSGAGITLNTTTVNSDTEIVVNVTLDAAAAPGDRDVTVTNAAPGGGTSGAQTFTVTT